MARVMVLEDDTSLRRFLSIFLGSRGHQISFDAGSGHVGLACIAREPEGTDVILSDLRMPIADGLDVLAGARALGSRAAVVLASAHWTDEEVMLARDLGAFALLAKPFDLEALGRAIDAAAASVCAGSEKKVQA
ncbi:response regulator [bacterium]|nr:response regulator [bacterium]